MAISQRTLQETLHDAIEHFNEKNVSFETALDNYIAQPIDTFKQALNKKYKELENAFAELAKQLGKIKASISKLTDVDIQEEATKTQTGYIKLMNLHLNAMVKLGLRVRPSVAKAGGPLAPKQRAAEVEGAGAGQDFRPRG